jgi:hypothetical protein
MKLLFIDNLLGSGITGRIVRMISYIYKYLHNNNINLDDITHIYIKVTEIPEMNCIFTESVIPDKTININASNDYGYGINLYNIFAQQDNMFAIYSKITKLINFNTIADSINGSCYNLGIHIRLTDMNKSHGDIYGSINYQNYIKTIDNYLLNNNNCKTIFLASDNIESQENIISNLTNLNVLATNIHYHNNKLISNTAINENFTEYQKKMFSNKLFFIEVMRDVFELAKCKHLIYRTSNVANLAILLSDSLKYDNVTLLNRK